MKDFEIPPDATVFRSGGVTYFLYMGALEMKALQREWGLQRSQVDSAEAWEKKTEEFQDRLNGAAMEDKVTVLRHALKRWAEASANGSGPVELTDEKVIEIAEQAEQPKDRKRKAPFVVIADLHRQFYSDCFGLGPFEAEQATADPKEKRQEGSTPSTS